jgi:hypothetical protein
MCDCLKLLLRRHKNLEPASIAVITQPPRRDLVL